MSHWSWDASDAHISWSYEQAGISIEQRVPARMAFNDREGGHDYTAQLQGYEHILRIVDRVEEVSAEEPEHPSRWPVILEMSGIMVAHYRIAGILKGVEEGRYNPDWLESSVFKGLLEKVGQTSPIES
jgi:hypothetical protein